MTSLGDDTVLVIRMWKEPGIPEDGTDWRGRVDLLPDGERRFFVGAKSLFGILDERLGDAADVVPSADAAAAPTPQKPALARAGILSSKTHEDRQSDLSNRE